MTDEAIRAGDAALAHTAEAQAHVGETLARTRCSVGLSIEDVAQQLKFSVRLLDALEKGRMAELPGGVFARGMVRSYARLLKLDPAPLVERMADAVVAPPAIDDAVSFRKPVPFADTARRVNLGYAAVMLAVLALVAAVLVEWPRDAIAPAVVSVAPAKPVATSAPQEASREAPVAVPLAAVALPNTATDAVPQAAAAGVPGVQRILLRFEGASWVEVRSGDGKVLISDLNGAGTMRSVEGAGPFSLVIGNAGQVRLSYNDRPVDLAPHTRLDVARLTLE